MLKPLKKELTPLQIAAQNFDEELASTNVFSDEYPELLQRRAKLKEIMEPNSKNSVSKDTLALIAGNLAGIALIVSFEKSNVLATKSLMFLKKLI